MGRHLGLLAAQTYTPQEAGLDARHGVEAGACEPILTGEDIELWEAHREMTLRHAATAEHRERVRDAVGHIRAMLGIYPDAYVAWSAGKDSTILAHLVLCVAASEGRPLPRLFSVKDDCDYPGEVAYLRHWASAWGVLDKLDIRTPPHSLREWLTLGGDMRDASDDLHSRGVAFSDEAFYGVIAAYDAERSNPGAYLGLRAQESKGRARNLWTRGEIYEKRDGKGICQPLARWTTLDLYAYAHARGIEFLHTYRCCALYGSPEEVRKSWFLPGTHAARGQGVFLRRYYPSLYRLLCQMMPSASRIT